jgi:nucleoside-diphosphate-sugar epimerase
MSKILALTGVTGKKSGGVLAEEISANREIINTMFPDGIRALVRQSSNTDNLKRYLPDVELCVGELNDIEYLKKSFSGVDTIIHIAGIHYSRDVVKAAAECNVRRLILVHTTGVYSKYKAAGEEYRHIDDDVYKICKENGILLTICRPTMIYGNIYDENVVKFVKMVDKLPIMPVVNGARYALQPVHYSDLGKAYYSILMNEEGTKNKDYNLSGGAPIYLRDMLKIIGKNLGKKVKFISCPFVIAYAGAWVVYCCSFGKMDYREKVQRLCEPRTFSFEDAARDFGYKPLTFEEGIIDEVKQYKENNGYQK